MPFTKRNLARLEKALDGLNPVHRQTPQALPLSVAADFPRGLKNMYLRTDLGVLDCLGKISGVGGYRAVLRQSVVAELPIGPCRVLSLTALLDAKRALDRPQDRLAVAHLESIQLKSKTK
jgi:hypothetical protein